MLLKHVIDTFPFYRNLRCLAFAYRKSRAPTLVEASALQTGPLSGTECDRIEEMGFEHFPLHSVAVRQADDAPLCPKKNGPCRPLGCVIAIYRAFGLLGSTSSNVLVTELVSQMREASASLRGVERALEAYGAQCKERHERGIYLLRHDHESLCEARASLIHIARYVQDVFRKAEEAPLLSQYLAEIRVPAGAFHAMMEDDLLENAWSVDEVIVILRDGDGGTPRQRKARLRKRAARLKSDEASAVPPDRLRN